MCQLKIAKKWVRWFNQTRADIYSKKAYFLTIFMYLRITVYVQLLHYNNCIMCTSITFFLLFLQKCYYNIHAYFCK